MGIGKIKPLFTPSHPPASAHPRPPCARWCPRLGAAHPPHAARLAQTLPGRARRRPHPRRASPVGSQQATGPRRRARPGRRPGSQRWPPDGGGWPCAAWVMGRRRRWGGGGGTDSNAMSLLKNAMSLLLKRLIQASGGAGWATGWVHTGCGKGRLIFLYPAQPPATPAGGATRRRALGRECPALSTRV